MILCIHTNFSLSPLLLAQRAKETCFSEMDSFKSKRLWLRAWSLLAEAKLVRRVPNQRVYLRPIWYSARVRGSVVPSFPLSLSLHISAVSYVTLYNIHFIHRPNN